MCRLDIYADAVAVATYCMNELLWCIDLSEQFRCFLAVLFRPFLKIHIVKMCIRDRLSIIAVIILSLALAIGLASCGADKSEKVRGKKKVEVTKEKSASGK